MPKQLVLNTWHNFEENTGVNFFKRNPVEITASQVNLGKSTEKEIIRQFKRGDEEIEAAQSLMLRK